MSKKQVTVGDQVRQAVRAFGLSQRALGRLANLDNTTLCRFLSGERGLSMEKLDRLGRILDLRVIAGKAKGR